MINEYLEEKMSNVPAAVFEHLRQAARSFAKDESGVTSIEYALIGALIAVVIVVSVTNVGVAVGALFGYVATEVAAAA